MRILQLGKAYPPANLGGVEVTIKLINEGLHGLGISCDVLGVNDSFFSKKEVSLFGTIYRESLIIKAFSTLFSVKLIYRLFLIRNNYDVIHIHHPDPMSIFAVWLVRPKCKLVLHWHSDILKQSFLLILYKPFQNWILNKCNAIICTSIPYAENSLHLKAFINKVSIIPIGIDKSSLKIHKPTIENIRNKFHNKKIVLSIGRFAYYKGYEFLIEAVKDFDKDIVLILIGEGELKSRLQEKVIGLQLSEKVFFLGEISNVQRNCYLYMAELFVLSSIYKTEAFGIAQIEAMAFGKPIVSTKIPNSGVDWVNQNMVSGITVQIRDAKAISSAVNLILNDKNLYSNLSVGSFKRFNANFTQVHMSNSIKILYENILK